MACTLGAALLLVRADALLALEAASGLPDSSLSAEPRAGSSDDAADAASRSRTGGGGTESEELDEIVVRGTRLWQLREAIVEAEERFYARYNELNENDDFDVHCRRDAPLGTRLKQRVCRIAFHEEAQAEHAQALFTGSDHAPDPDVVWLERRAAYQANALKVINGDRRLQALVRERERLERLYEDERRKRFNGRRIHLE